MADMRIKIKSKRNDCRPDARGMRLARSKKAIEVWVSFVLLMTFVILLAAIVSYWMRDYIKSTVEDLKQRSYTSEYCDAVGIEIRDLVIKDSQNVNMVIINTYNLGVDKIIFRSYDLNDNVYINITNVTIKPNQNKTLSIHKNLTTYRIEAVPVLFYDEKEVICKDKMVWKNIT